MSELGELYQEVVLDHTRRPRNHGPIDGPDAEAEGHNPLCGDRVTVQLKVERGEIVGIGIQGAGCAISTASASLMSEAVKGLSVDQAQALFEAFRHMLTGSDEPDPQVLGKLVALGGVRDYPLRVKCATLAWHTLVAALDDQSVEPVSTE